MWVQTRMSMISNISVQGSTKKRPGPLRSQFWLLIRFQKICKVPAGRFWGPSETSGFEKLPRTATKDSAKSEDHHSLVVLDNLQMEDLKTKFIPSTNCWYLEASFRWENPCGDMDDRKREGEGQIFWRSPWWWGRVRGGGWRRRGRWRRRWGGGCTPLIRASCRGWWRLGLSYHYMMMNMVTMKMIILMIKMVMTKTPGASSHIWRSSIFSLSAVSVILGRPFDIKLLALYYVSHPWSTWSS